MSLFQDLQGSTIQNIWRMDHDPEYDEEHPEAIHINFDQAEEGITIKLVDDDETILVVRESFDTFTNYFGAIYINDFAPNMHFGFKGQPLIDVKVGIYRGPIEVADGHAPEADYTIWAVKIFLAGGSFYFYNSGSEGHIEFNPVDDPPVMVPLQWL